MDYALMIRDHTLLPYKLAVRPNLHKTTSASLLLGDSNNQTNRHYTLFLTFGNCNPAFFLVCVVVVVLQNLCCSGTRLPATTQFVGLPFIE